jgi:hypothetical protein
VVTTVNWPSAACKAQTAMLLAKMTRLQKAGQMVSAVKPPVGEVTANQYGSILSGGNEGTICRLPATHRPTGPP